MSSAGAGDTAKSEATDRSASREAAVADFARRWQTGVPESIEETLARYPALKPDVDVVLDLIYQEVLLRTAQGEQPKPDDSASRLPECEAALDPIFELNLAI